MTTETIQKRITELHELIENAQDNNELAQLDNELEIMQLALIEMEENEKFTKIKI
jgi:hypothetical protein